MSTLTIAGTLALFFVFGFLFIFVNLCIGRLLRPHDPHEEKQEIYECGEPTIGSGFVQFDLRFYVVALLFLIFDVEVALFFPWATVFGKANALQDARVYAQPAAAGSTLPAPVLGIYRELGVPQQMLPQGQQTAPAMLQQQARQLAVFSLWDILVFFAVLMVGFAYVWYRGDLDWVRAYARPKPTAVVPPRKPREQRPAASALA